MAGRGSSATETAPTPAPAPGGQRRCPRFSEHRVLNESKHIVGLAAQNGRAVLWVHRAVIEKYQHVLYQVTGSPALHVHILSGETTAAMPMLVSWLYYGKLPANEDQPHEDELRTLAQLFVFAERHGIHGLMDSAIDGVHRCIAKAGSVSAKFTVGVWSETQDDSQLQKLLLKAHSTFGIAEKSEADQQLEMMKGCPPLLQKHFCEVSKPGFTRPQDALARWNQLPVCDYHNHRP